ncbi:hypothetical protein ACIHFD_49800 [Nonomuraea sp. NPDC051941]|uniref:hypothetical protein n=1 Tax=Nonomuraea sp. NPDC051941 TaxID=3364373 RepID=UPI0037C67972
MTKRAADLVNAYADGDKATTHALRLTEMSLGEPATYPLIRAAAANARDHYAIWAELMGREAVAEEIRALGRIVRLYLDSLADARIHALAIEQGFPADSVGHVSADALRLWLNTAYAEDNPQRAHVLNKALERRDEHIAKRAALMAAKSAPGVVIIATFS